MKLLSKYTKAEVDILCKVQEANKLGAFAGLGTSPTDSNFTSKEMRFVRRLNESGAIVWMPYHPKLGSGWALEEFVDTFLRENYNPHEVLRDVQREEPPESPKDRRIAELEAAVKFAADSLESDSTSIGPVVFNLRRILAKGEA